MRCLLWLLILLLTGTSAIPAWARGGGGCLMEGTPILTPAGASPVESLNEGDLVWGVVGRALQAAHVEALTKTEAEAYLEVSAGEFCIFITPEHPVMVGPGEFRNAGRLQPGDRVGVVRGDRFEVERVNSVRRVLAERAAYNLLVYPGGTFIPGGIVVHNKGCFLPESPILKADGEEVPISEVLPGDKLLAFASDGRLVQTTVQNVLRLEVDEHIVLRRDRETIRVTADHPFYVGDGTFKTLEVLRVGDHIIAWDGQSLVRQEILSAERIPGIVHVFNLQTDQPHTFFVGHTAVHNKGGGGGCFPPGTQITTPHGQVPIESIIPGDEVLAVTDLGFPVPAMVKALHVTRNRLIRMETQHGSLEASPEHPVALSGGGFRAMGHLHPGDRVLRWADGQPAEDEICGVSRIDDLGPVYNLQVDAPHTFLASSYLVHNKGGSFSSGHSRSSGSSGGGAPWDPVTDTLILAVQFVFFALVIYVLVKKRRAAKSENLDFVYSSSEIARKATRTDKLLQFLSQQDPSMAPESLRKLAESTFRKLQECWGTRQYDPMEPLLMPSLYAQHSAQLRGMARNHEINRIEDLKVERVDLVNVRYTEKPDRREFTALISAFARDYYVEDKTGKFIRGDKTAARFQEFWTFQRLDNRWLLREIEQSGESDCLKDENFVEMLTDQSLQGIYGEAAGKEGAAGPWLEKEVETKATRIERMLNFLVQTDKLWNRQAMQERAREVFLRVYLARETGDPAEAPAADLFPDVAEHLRDQIAQWRLDGLAVEYRNLCVRKVEILLVRNFKEPERDEFTVRISAHAQRVVRKGHFVQSEDRYVTPFEDYWTFGRLDQQWKLKEVLPPAAGRKRVAEENVDEDSSAGQLQWYYRQTRAN